MKKSEMILSIASNIVISKPYINFKEAQELAEIALISVEENGMQPPSRLLTDSGYAFYSLQWEPENE